MPSSRYPALAHRARRGSLAPVRRHPGREPSDDQWRVQTFEKGPGLLILAAGTKATLVPASSALWAYRGLARPTGGRNFTGDGIRSRSAHSEGGAPFLL